MPDHPTDDADGSSDGNDGERELPEDLITEAERLTRLARDAVEDAEAAAYRADAGREVTLGEAFLAVRGLPRGPRGTPDRKSVV